jgi:hypothetical protein
VKGNEYGAVVEYVILEILVVTQLVKKLFDFYETRTFDFRVYKSPPTVCDLSHMRPVHNPMFYLCKTNFHIVIPSNFRSPECLS